MSHIREDGSYCEDYYFETPDGITLTTIEYPGDCKVDVEVVGKISKIVIRKV